MALLDSKTLGTVYVFAIFDTRNNNLLGFVIAPDKFAAHDRYIMSFPEMKGIELKFQEIYFDKNGVDAGE